ncbi:MAG TPA: zinc-binding dehydrogenase [Pseudonocardiaceae bacterium]
MRAVLVTAFGGPEVLALTTVPDTDTGPGQVVVDVAVAGVLSVDTMIRSGHGGDYFPVQPPYVPGVGVAGRVSSVGEGVDEVWIGRRVLADIEGGGYAERVVAAVADLIPIPQALDSREAVALLHDGSTALALFEAVRVQRDESVLVQPAAGGLGSLLVQLASAAGARVIGAARGGGKLELVKELGADAAVDYSTPDWTERVREMSGGGVHVAFDGVGGDLGRAAFETVIRGGRFSSYGMAGGAPTVIGRDDARQRQVIALGMEQLPGFAADRMERVERMLHEAVAGRIRPIIGRTYPLERAADAHAAIADRSLIGKALLLI